MESTDGNITYTVAANLQAIRRQRKMTLQTLSELTGVSKSMLGEIERGTSNPTINVLWKIVTGLKIPISEIIHAPASDYRLIHEHEWRSLSKRGCTLSLIFEYNPMHNFEIYHLTFLPNSEHESHSHQRGVVEYTMVYEGSLTIIVNEEKSVINKGDSFVFDAESPHTYLNDGDVPAKAYSIIYYPPKSS